MSLESKIEPAKNSHSSFRQTAWEWTKVIVVALIISAVVRSFVAEPFIVQGASMDPTFSTNQFLIVDRISYRFGNPERGDVIVFAYPGDTRIDYIKRIIGLPGETIKIKEGVVSITNAAHPEGFILNETYIAPGHRSFDNMETTLSSTQYFTMGDNRAESSDSRAWGPLDRKLIIGRPILRLLPLTVLPGEYHEQK